MAYNFLRKQWKIAGMIVLLPLVGVLTFLAFAASSNSTPESKAPEIPDAVAGHQVLLVSNKETTLCYRLDYPRIVLGAYEESIDEFLTGGGHSTVKQELEKLGFVTEGESKNIAISYVGPSETKEHLLELQKERNERDAIAGCPQEVEDTP
jgi:hypothetical protein